MKAYEAVRQAAMKKGVPLSHIGAAMGKTPSYVNSGITRGSTPQADTLATMLGVCGYALAAVPLEDMPPSALKIDQLGDEDGGTAIGPAAG